MATYPQESAGVTLLSCEHGGERRRVFARRRGTRLEVGEFTRGPLTSELYDAPAHHHCIQLSASGMNRIFFAQLSAELCSRCMEYNWKMLLKFISCMPVIS